MRLREGVRMARRRSVEKSVPVSISLPEPVYAFLEWAAHQKGLTVSAHIREWILGSLAPWEEPSLPLDAHSTVEMPDEAVHAVPVVLKSADNDRPKREDFPDDASFLKAERAERQARGDATRKRNREAHPPPLPEHLLRIAEARRQHSTMPIRQFSQLLFDQGIYRSNEYGSGAPNPVSHGCLERWLKRLREAGLLSEH
jgi:hypothetical protein